MIGPVASLNTAWFALLGLLWTGYFVLEGFDFGVGVLSLPLGRDDTDRRLARNAIGPVWDGNEVWLIVAGGATFAAFPLWYASMFSAFYLALFIVLVALIVRGVSFEFRGKRDTRAWRAGWDWALGLGSLIPAFAWGVLFTDLVHGLPLSRAGFYFGGLAPAAGRGRGRRPGQPGHVPGPRGHVPGAENVWATGRPGSLGRGRAVRPGGRPGGRDHLVAGQHGRAQRRWPAWRGAGRTGRRVRAGLPGVRGAGGAAPAGRRVRAERAGDRGGQRRRLHRAVPPGGGLDRARAGADHLECRLRAPDPAGDDRGSRHLRPVRARLPGLELLGVPAAADPPGRPAQPPAGLRFPAAGPAYRRGGEPGGRGSG